MRRRNRGESLSRSSARGLPDWSEFWSSRHREFRADAGEARLAGRDRMIDLRTTTLPDQMAAFGISGRARQGIARLFMTHSPIDERIARLKAVEPLVAPRARTIGVSPRAGAVIFERKSRGCDD
jgi:hypothetical protein